MSLLRTIDGAGDENGETTILSYEVFGESGGFDWRERRLLISDRSAIPHEPELCRFGRHARSSRL